MRSLSIPFAVFLFASVSCTGVSLAADIPPETFSIGNATIGVTTLSEVQKIYGAAESSRVGREDEADVRVCYAYSASKGRSFLIFESGVMGSFKQITGFRVSTIRPSANCVSTTKDIGTLETKNGIRLGQSLADFKKAVPVVFKRRGSEFTYEVVGRRVATPEELERLRAKWPNEKQDYFDVTMSLSAKFKNGRLIDFYAHKIESY